MWELEVALHRSIEGGGDFTATVLLRLDSPPLLTIAGNGHTAQHQLQSQDLKGLLQALAEVQVALAIRDSFVGLGSGTLLTFRHQMTTMTFSWVRDVPDEWASLAPVVNAISRLARRQGIFLL